MSEFTRRDLLLSSVGIAGLSFFQTSCAAADDQTEKRETRQYTRLAYSPETKMNGAGFRAETEDRWNSMNLSVYPVSLRLRITNRSDRPLLFPFFDTFGMLLYNPDETEHELDGGRDGTRPVMRPLLLEPGEDYSIVPTVQLRWNRDTRELRVVYEDGTGTILRTGLLPEGKYSISFWYAVAERWKKGFAERIPQGAVWQGQVKTEPVAFEIVHP